jgi:hypothetical protein
MAEDTYDILRKVVAETTCFPDWDFRIVDDKGALRLVIRIDGVNNYDHSKPFLINHHHPVPSGVTYHERAWRRWVHSQCLRVLTHELGENLQFNGIRPFAPMHGPGEDPYTVHEIRSEKDALTIQDGSLREGPV